MRAIIIFFTILSLSAETSFLSYLDASYNVSNSNKNLLPRGQDYINDELFMNQLWARLENDSKVKYRIDAFYGTDYRFSLQKDLFNKQHREYGFDLIQFYLEYNYEKSNFKLGRVLLPYGIESFESWNSPLASKSYSFFYNPYSQTGLHYNYKYSDDLNLTAIASIGNDLFISDLNKPTLSLGASYKNYSVFVIGGESKYDKEESFNYPAILDFTAKFKLTDKFDYNFNAITGLVRDYNDSTANWFGLSNYLIYKLNEKNNLIYRLEYFDDQDGNRFAKSKIFANTIGYNYQVCSNLWLRPEVRYDQADEKIFNEQNKQITGTLNLVLKAF